MKEGIVDTNLMFLDETDYKTFDELYELVMNNLIDKVVNKGQNFWNIECNEIRIDSSMFKLPIIWQLHNENTIQRKDFENDYTYENEVESQLKNRILFDLVSRLSQLEQNENIDNFLGDASKSLQIEIAHQKN